MRPLRGVVLLCVLTMSLVAVPFAGRAGAQTTCVPPPNGLVAWWPMDESEGVTAADTVDGHHGTLVNEPVFTTGMVGNGLSFDGIDDYVRVPHSNAFDLGQLTLEAWFKSSQPFWTYGIVWSKNPTVYGYWDPFYLRIDCCDGKGYGRVGGGGVLYVEAATDIPVNDDQFHHLALTFDGTTLKMYRDGSLTDSQLVDFQTLVNTEDVFIGQWTGLAPLHNYRGLIDELSLYSRALSAEEVAAIFHAGSAGKCRVQPVEIDIKPGSSPNSINLSSAGVVPVAILSSSTFDATTVDPATVSLAGASVKMVGKSGNLAHAADVNDDGLVDLVCQVNTAQFMIEPGDSMAILEARTLSGQRIRGEDSIRIVP